MLRNEFNSPLIPDDRLLEDCLYDAFAAIVEAKIPTDAKKPFVRCYEDIRYGLTFNILSIPYSASNKGGTASNIEQSIVEELSEHLQDAGFRISFDQDGMEILLDQGANDVSKFCEYAIVLHPDKNKKLAERIASLKAGAPARHASLN